MYNLCKFTLQLRCTVVIQLGVKGGNKDGNE